VVTGEVPDIRAHLAGASVFVCPVRLGSGLRVKLLEAMAAGVPIVSTTLGTDGIPVCNGEHLLVADTPEMMARGVELLLDDAELRVRLSRAGRALVRERFAWDRTIAMLEQTLRAVMRQP
jgi:glycosyltransferase involved in cell wall biosynthesis